MTPRFYLQASIMGYAEHVAMRVFVAALFMGRKHWKLMECSLVRVSELISIHAYLADTGDDATGLCCPRR